MLARHMLYCLNHMSSSFCTGYFGGRGSLFVLAGLDLDPSIYLSLLRWMTGMSQLLVEMGRGTCEISGANLEP
jgi:hypothetical protein